MKKYINILIPVTTAIAPIAGITSCNKQDEYKDIPKQYLKITNGLLEGFDQDHEQEQDLDGYNTLVIPKEVTSIKSQSFSTQVGIETEYTAPNAIKKVTYEQGCQITNFSCGEQNASYGFNFWNLAKLESVYFPPTYTGSNDRKLFWSSFKVKLLDLSQCENLQFSTGEGDDSWIWWSALNEDGGKIIFNKKTDKTRIEYVKSKLESQHHDWIVVIK